ncbi:MAG TPA: sigma-70 family RNA polymerase sigma factor [Anaerolineae bacterium]
MTQEPNLQRLTIAGLAHRCAQETERFFQRQSHDPRYCFELFRRAIREQNQHAWEVIYTQYRALVTGWVHDHPALESTGEEADYFANTAFEKIWASLTPERFERFPDLASVLRYLQMCVSSVILDHVRAAERAKLEVPMEVLSVEPSEPGPAIEEAVLDRARRQEFWEWLDAWLRDEKERRVIYGLFVLALKPQKLYQQSRTMFNDVREIYRIKQNVIARLSRDPEFRRRFHEND